MLVEDPVVREELLAVHAAHRAVRADERGIGEIAVECRAADERDCLRARARDLVDGLARSVQEPRPQEEILRRVAGDRELGQDDDVGPGALCLPHGAHDLLDVPVEISDDDVQLRESQPHPDILSAVSYERPRGFRLTITNFSLNDRWQRP